jgi:hemoglobin
MFQLALIYALRMHDYVHGKLHAGPITEADLKRVIPAFYTRVRGDALIGPLFNSAIDDWPQHLDRLVDFWSSVMLTTGRYKGSPMAAHLRHKHAISPIMFDRWLALWTQTTSELLSPPTARAMQTKAAQIAESLRLALFFKLDGPAGASVPPTE